MSDKRKIQFNLRKRVVWSVCEYRTKMRQKLQGAKKQRERRGPESDTAEPCPLLTITNP